MKIKIFESDVSADELENKINVWIKESKTEIISTNVNVVIMHDYHMDSSPLIVCNVWHKYICTIIYMPHNMESV